jgi:hypothetical protein
MSSPRIAQVCRLWAREKPQRERLDGDWIRKNSHDWNNRLLRVLNHIILVEVCAR